MTHLFSIPFPSNLKKGIIIAKPFRFVALLKGGEKAFLPVPTNIGNISFNNIPCLYSSNPINNKKTIQALIVRPHTNHLEIVGINQNSINKIYAELIKAGAFKKILKTKDFLTEVPLHNKRIDFASNDIWLEIKMPLTVLPFNNSSSLTNYKHRGTYLRTIEQYKLLTKEVKKGKRAIVFITYLYNAPKYNPFEQNYHNKLFLKTIITASKMGVEFWQHNFSIDKKNTTLTKSFKLNFLK